MKTDRETLAKIQSLLGQYFNEIYQAEKEGFLQPNAVKTYTLHSDNFVRWCAGEFEPGARNKSKVKKGK